MEEDQISKKLRAIHDVAVELRKEFFPNIATANNRRITDLAIMKMLVEVSK